MSYISRVKPLAYLGWLIGHEGSGSILSYLKKRYHSSLVLSSVHTCRESCVFCRVPSLWHWTLCVALGQCFCVVMSLDLTRLPSKEHLRWQQTTKLLAYRESTQTILNITCPSNIQSTLFCHQREVVPSSYLTFLLNFETILQSIFA